MRDRPLILPVSEYERSRSSMVSGPNARAGLDGIITAAIVPARAARLLRSPESLAIATADTRQARGVAGVKPLVTTRNSEAIAAKAIEASYSGQTCSLRSLP